MRMGQPEIDLFAWRLSHQLPVYIAWKADPPSLGTDAMQQIWSHKLLYAFTPSALIPRVLRKVEEDQVNMMILITPTWQTQVWFPELLRLSIAKPLLIPNHKFLLTNPQAEVNPLVQNQTLRLAAWKVSGKSCLRKEFRKQLPFLSQVQGGMAQSLITIRPGGSGLAGVLKRKLIHY